MRNTEPHDRPIKSWRLILPLTLLLLASLACGGFQVRVTPTVTPPSTETPEAQPTSTVEVPTATATSQPAETVTSTVEVAPTAPPVVGLAAGGTAKISAGGGLNVRAQAAKNAKQVGKLNSGAAVTLTGGPTEADGFTWWEVDNGSGVKGWVAAGPANDPWLKPDAPPPPSSGEGSSGGKLVNRPIVVGDRVRVTTQGNQVLTVRDEAGTGGAPKARVVKETEFMVRGGPVRENEMLWWQLEGEKVNGWAAEGQGEDRWLTPVE